jgi:hypothetical protein
MTRTVAVALLLFAVQVHAEPVRCRGTIAKESAKYAQAAEKRLQSCRERVRIGALPPSTDCHADPLIAKAVTKLAQGVARDCCGSDETCGNGDDDSLASIGWDVGVCPDLANHGCSAPIAHPGDVASCLACTGRFGADTALDLLYTRFAPPADSIVARCQATLGKENARLFRSVSKALARCWDGRNRGAHANACPDPGDGKAPLLIARARELYAVRVCAACGGPDKQCGGPDDLSTTSIGTADHCPAVERPDGVPCGGVITSFAHAAACADCLAAFANLCADQVAVPAFAPYAAECHPPPGTCSAGVECETALDCPAGYTCRDNGGRTRYCLGPACDVDAECTGGAVCRQYCDVDGCEDRICQCPGFGCFGPDEVCLDDGGIACRKLCTQDSDCVAPFGDVCVNPGFGFGVCIGSIPCS